jgi:hypothetical protein
MRLWAAAAVVTVSVLWLATPDPALSEREPIAAASHCKQGYVPRGGQCVRSRKCRRNGVESVARTSTARLLVLERGGEEVWYGCLFARDRMQRLRALDEPYSRCVHTCEYIGPVRLAGTYAALVYSWSFSYGGGVPDDGGSSVEIYDIRTGRGKRTYPGYPEVLLLAENGDSVTFAGGELWIRGRDGDDRLLDRGSDIAHDSIRLDGRTVSWTKGGEARQASF